VYVFRLVLNARIIHLLHLPVRRLSNHNINCLCGGLQLGILLPDLLLPGPHFIEKHLTQVPGESRVLWIKMLAHCSCYLQKCVLMYPLLVQPVVLRAQVRENEGKVVAVLFLDTLFRFQG
jgi:hypothetical protein